MGRCGPAQTDGLTTTALPVWRQTIQTRRRLCRELNHPFQRQAAVDTIPGLRCSVSVRLVITRARNPCSVAGDTAPALPRATPGVREMRTQTFRFTAAMALAACLMMAVAAGASAQSADGAAMAPDGAGQMHDQGPTMDHGVMSDQDAPIPDMASDNAATMADHDSMAPAT